MNSFLPDSWTKLKAFVDGVTVKRLVEAVRAGDIGDVAAILKLRPELVNTVEAWNYEYTALHYAVLVRMPDMVRLLMKSGADPHAGISPHNDATSALTVAIERGYDEIAAIISEEEKRREEGRPTADLVPAELRRALRSGDEKAAISVLESHPELVHFETPGERRTPLHLASALLLPRMAAWLLDHGANVNARTSDGSTPLDVIGLLCDPSERAAKICGVVALLRERGAELTERSAVILGNLDALRHMHAQGDLITPRDGGDSAGPRSGFKRAGLRQRNTGF